MPKKTIAISLGDINGVGIQLALQNHKNIKKLCNPIYCINDDLLNQAAKLLNIKIPKSFNTYKTKGKFKIKAGQVSKKSGLFSYNSFMDAINLVKNKKAIGVCTLPINKESWSKAGIHYVGHTDMLRDVFKKDAIMMLGCPKMYVALYTEHIALKKVAFTIKYKKLKQFFIDFYNSEKPKKVSVLGLNPHAGDNGVLGDEEKIIIKAIKAINKDLKKEVFIGPCVPDIAFSPNFRDKYTYFIAMYHDQGLAPLKALYFDESINVSLNLPILRTSVDHGTAFDIAYKNNNNLSSLSYINAVKKLIK
ncbi:MAG TPA: 4-hydroxythreonine-4-phosphate dehydrogenase [Arcobacter sp.]|nr:4-hydroxythreonine-4-phosphate dehydrogenase [Arcobacter sp.]HIP55424.1 4-hydroxythreonine-4-phosphate dehydrogenase [Arcobacter sp.]